MGTASKAPQRPTAKVGTTRNFSLSCVGELDSGELMTGAVTATEQTTSDLTITNAAVSTAALTINDVSVAIGKAIQCSVSGQLAANSPYTIEFAVSTDATPPQNLLPVLEFKAEA